MSGKYYKRLRDSGETRMQAGDQAKMQLAMISGLQAALRSKQSL